MKNPKKPCRKCGLVDRYDGGHCRPCAKARHDIWRAKNPERKKYLDAKWAKENPDKVRINKARYAENNRDSLRVRARLAARKYRASHPDRVRDTNKKWTSNNLDKKRVYNKNRQALLRVNGGILSINIVQKLFELQGGKCPCCGGDLGNKYHLDHRMPIALGGKNKDSNMQLLTATCNLQKHDKHPVEFMQSRGFLL